MNCEAMCTQYFMTTSPRQHTQDSFSYQSSSWYPSAEYSRFKTGIYHLRYHITPGKLHTW